MITFIINPSSGGGKSLRVWKRLEDELNKRGVSYKAIITKYKGEASEFVASLCEDNNDTKADDIVVAVGGDGTVNDMLQGIRTKKALIYAHIPAGTGNDLARGLALPKSPLDCLDKILRKSDIKEIDYGVLSFGDEGHRRFLVSCGMGFDASIVNEYSSLDESNIFFKGPFRKLTYVALGIKHLLETKSSKGFVVVGNMKKIEFNHILFASSHIHPYEGGGIKFAPNSINTDGKLDICLMHSSSKLKLARSLILAFIGKHIKNSGVRYGAYKEMNIHFETPSFVHADGELCGKYTDIKITCIRNKLRFIC